MRRFWQPVALLDDVAPGRAKPIQIMSEWFTLYRGATGKPHVVGFRCAHRGTQMSTGWVEDDLCAASITAGSTMNMATASNNRLRSRICEQSNDPRLSDPRVSRIRVRVSWKWRAAEFPRVPAFERAGHLVSFRGHAANELFQSNREQPRPGAHQLRDGRSEFTVSGINREIPELGTEETAYGLRKVRAIATERNAFQYTLMPNSKRSRPSSTRTRDGCRISPGACRTMMIRHEFHR